MVETPSLFKILFTDYSASRLFYYAIGISGFWGYNFLRNRETFIFEWIDYVILLIALGLFAVVIWRVRRLSHLIQEGADANARVSKLTNALRFVQVYLEYTVAGVEVKGITTLPNKLRGRLNVGDTVKVKYDPEKPSWVIIPEGFV